MAALQEEKNSLMSENEVMNDRLDQLDGSLDDTNTAVTKKYFHAQLQLEQLQEENFRYGLVACISIINFRDLTDWLMQWFFNFFTSKLIVFLGISIPPNMKMDFHTS